MPPPPPSSLFSAALLPARQHTACARGLHAWLRDAPGAAVAQRGGEQRSLPRRTCAFTMVCSCQPAAAVWRVYARRAGLVRIREHLARVAAAASARLRKACAAPALGCVR
jgi:hypothetical protein